MSMVNLVTCLFLLFWSTVNFGQIFTIFINIFIMMNSILGFIWGLVSTMLEHHILYTLNSSWLLHSEIFSVESYPKTPTVFGATLNTPTYKMYMTQTLFAPIPRMRCSFARRQPHLHTPPIHRKFCSDCHWLLLALIWIFSHNGLVYEYVQKAWESTEIMVLNSPYLPSNPIFGEFFFTTR